MPKTYILKNISTSDVNIGDLGYRIPAGKSRDLLRKTAYLKWEQIEKSRKSGSIFKRLGKSLIEVDAIVEATPPSKQSVTRESGVVKFPDRVKSSVTINMGDISEEIQELVINEDDELLKQLDAESMLEDGQVPVISKDGNEK